MTAYFAHLDDAALVPYSRGLRPSRVLVRSASLSTCASRSVMSAARRMRRAAPLPLGRRLRFLRSRRIPLKAPHVRFGCPRLTLRASRPRLRASAHPYRARPRFAFARSTLFGSRRSLGESSPKLPIDSRAFLGASQEAIRASRTSIGAARASNCASSVLTSDTLSVLVDSRRVLGDALPIG